MTERKYNFNFGPPQQNPSQSSPQPSPRNNTSRRVFIVLGVITSCLFLCCLGFVGLLYFQREQVMVTYWLEWAAPSESSSLLNMQDVLSNVEQAEQIGILCRDSQASEFSRRFFELYGKNISIGNVVMASDEEEGIIIVTGTWDSSTMDETLDYEAEFTVNTDEGGYLGFMGCLENINQISPEIPNNALDEIFGG